MGTFPPELVELIIYHAWGCLSNSIREHGRSMARWILVSRDWLNIVLSVVFRDLWITSLRHLLYIAHMCSSDTSFIFQTAGITHPRRYLANTCCSLTVSVYQDPGGYASQCADLMDRATTDSDRLEAPPCLGRHKSETYTIPFDNIPTFIRTSTPHVTALDFVVVDCIPTYAGWEAFTPEWYSFMTSEYPPTLTALHITFAYTAAPPLPLVLDAARGTFFPPRSSRDLPKQCCFHGVRRLVVRDANADFVAFLTTVCPMLERVEATAAFGAEDVSQTVPAEVRERLVFVRLERADAWRLTAVTPPRKISIRNMIGGHFILRLLRRVLRERK
ncbi:hypothetical protein DFH07DRAFT_779672 [Mycena maculata]|uniref:Uncharacterized protein n=1 Tax=Mycena maculata TaxID=230809 RepID=A0AAD7I759_9AGAR|nr:hypothetical protein DFH07DRAFT_779672 [Mycena maculata]